MCRPYAEAVKGFKSVTQCPRHALHRTTRLFGRPIALGLSHRALFENDLLAMLFAADLRSSPLQFNDSRFLV